MSTTITGTTGASLVADGSIVTSKLADGGVTPQKLSGAAGTSASLGASGYQKFASGMIMQWGNTNTATTSFPISFPTACLSITPSVQYNSTGAFAGIYQTVTAMTTTNFTLAAAFSGLPGVVYYIAIGY
jgi:hypothetical protein